MIESTIAAIATARGPAGVAVIRLSGRKAWEIVAGIFSRKNVEFEAGRALHGWIQDDGVILDEVIVLTFKGPQSHTGEDIAEIHCHGGDVIPQKILSLCLRRGALPAQPGEFTKRAFLNGKMDLTQAESVMDLVSARSERLMQQASANLRNRSLGEYIDQVAAGLTDLQAKIVASVDFPDEVDEPDREEMTERLNRVRERVIHLRDGAIRNRLVRDGLKIALLGMPNSGKSSLFNALLTSNRSIVTAEAGTTRDIVTETMEIDGISVTLIDTAGIRETNHQIEIMGIERSWQAADEAQIVLYLIDTSIGLLRYDYQVLTRLDPHRTIIIGNKNDLNHDGSKLLPDWIYISATTGEGLAELYAAIQNKIRGITHEETDASMALNERQLSCCQRVAECLNQASEIAENLALPLDFMTVPITEALRNLDELMGRDMTEAVLTQVFQQFCVGK